MADFVGDKSCGPTHFFGCDCWEARQAKRIAALEAALTKAREALEHIKETAGSASSNRHAWALAQVGTTARIGLAALDEVRK